MKLIKNTKNTHKSLKLSVKKAQTIKTPARKTVNTKFLLKLIEI